MVGVLPAAPGGSLRSGAASDWRQVRLFARQALLDPHHGSLLGAGWLLVLPLIQILIYTLIFSRFMGARLGVSASPWAYSLYLVPGLLLWSAFANTVNNMASVYSARSAVIRKVPVNLVAMPAYVPLVEAILWAVAMAIFTVFCLAVGHPVGAAWLWLPVACALLLLLAWGGGLVLAALSLFAPDLRQVTSVVIQLAFWLTPVVYVVDILPPWLGAAMQWHPVYWAVGPAQQIVLHGELQGDGGLWRLALLALAVAAAGRWLVRRLERDIRDLL